MYKTYYESGKLKSKTNYGNGDKNLSPKEIQERRIDYYKDGFTPKDDDLIIKIYKKKGLSLREVLFKNGKPKIRYYVDDEGKKQGIYEEFYSGKEHEIKINQNKVFLQE